MDPIAEMAEMKGRADAEMKISKTLHKAAEEGDAKIALEILKHSHGWTAKQEITVDVYQRISITQALADANSRVINGLVINNETPNRANDQGLLTNNHSGDGNGYKFDNTRSSEISTDL
jgi:hypothetical protein